MISFTRTVKEGMITRISIENPEGDLGRFKYYYPDGIKKGFIIKQTYFVEDTLTGKFYYSVEEAIDDLDINMSDYFISSGRIIKPGKVTVHFEQLDPVTFSFTDKSRVLELIEDLMTYGLDGSHYISVDPPKVQSLYEYKESLRS